ncbi:YecA family protein [Marinobacteraceae bacterium S3BR75-40.1]
MLSNDDILALEDILFADEWADEALDFFGLHGVVCAHVVGPRALSMDVLFAIATGQDPANAKPAPEKFQQLCGRLETSLRKDLEQGHTLELPEPEDGDPRNALENWCAGFMDAFLLCEEEWMTRDEEAVANLLVPIMALSNLFDDEDFRKVVEDDELCAEMVDQIPENLTDLYLLFHSP